MKNRQIATRIIDEIEASQKLSDGQYQHLVKGLMNLALELINSEPGYGHAERLHNLTGGQDDGERHAST